LEEETFFYREVLPRAFPHPAQEAGAYGGGYGGGDPILRGKRGMGQTFDTPTAKARGILGLTTCAQYERLTW